MGMTSLPSAEDYVLELWPGGEEEEDSTGGESTLKKIFCVRTFLLCCLGRHFLPYTEH